jgi:hypothetical protein
VLGGAGVHHRAGPGLDLPRALARSHDERRPAESHHPGLEGRQRSQRRVHEQQPQDLSGQRVGLRVLLQPACECYQVGDLVAREIVKVEEALHRK